MNGGISFSLESRRLIHSLKTTCFLLQALCRGFIGNHHFPESCVCWTSRTVCPFLTDTIFMPEIREEVSTLPEKKMKGKAGNPSQYNSGIFLKTN